ncbi:unnamed protein product [Closterium sp. NIES-64]|nr:unnamed protein product [Closterium sp. NIES-64]
MAADHLAESLHAVSPDATVALAAGPTPALVALVSLAVARVVARALRASPSRRLAVQSTSRRGARRRQQVPAARYKGCSGGGGDEWRGAEGRGDKAERDDSKVAIGILFGTQTGTSEGFAKVGRVHRGRGLFRARRASRVARMRGAVGWGGWEGRACDEGVAWAGSAWLREMPWPSHASRSRCLTSPLCRRNPPAASSLPPNHPSLPFHPPPCRLKPPHSPGPPPSPFPLFPHPQPVPLVALTDTSCLTSCCMRHHPMGPHGQDDLAEDSDGFTAKLKAFHATFFLVATGAATALPPALLPAPLRTSGSAALLAAAHHAAIASPRHTHASCMSLCATSDSTRPIPVAALPCRALSYGDGEPTDDAQRFFKWLHATAAHAEAQDDSPVPLLGAPFLLSSGWEIGQYEHFNLMGKMLDKHLAALGGQRVAEVGLGDDDQCIEDDFKACLSLTQPLVPPLTPFVPHVCIVGRRAGLWKGFEALVLGRGAGGEGQQGEGAAGEWEDEEEEVQEYQVRFHSRVGQAGVAGENGELNGGLNGHVHEEMNGKMNGETNGKVNGGEKQVNGVGEHKNGGEEEEEQMSMGEAIAAVGWHSHSIGRARVAVVRELQAPNSDRSTLHVELDLSPCPHLQYEVGDHVAVFPENSDADVAAVAKCLGLDLDDVISLHLPSPSSSLPPPPPGRHSIRSVLASLPDLHSSPRKAALAVLAHFASHPDEAARLKHLASDGGKAEYREWVAAAHRSLLEVLQAFPSARPPLAVFLASVAPRLQPRFYSISSHPRHEPGALHITCAVVRDITPAGRIHHGVCSSFLHRHLPLPTPASTSPAPSPPVLLPAFIRSSHFRPPTDPTRPIVMVGPGTGLAPFRAFLQVPPLCFHCPSASTAPLLPLPLCFHCPSASTAPLLPLPLCFHCPSASTAPLLPLPLCFHCPSASTAPLLPLPLCPPRLPAVIPLARRTPWHRMLSLAAWQRHRALLQKGGQQLGEALLFFGCRHRHQDYIYREELAAYEESGVLSALHVAFSRDGPSKVYVQHLLKQQAERVWQVVGRRGGSVYVCGDAKAMARDVHHALLEVAVEQVAPARSASNSPFPPAVPRTSALPAMAPPRVSLLTTRRLSFAGLALCALLAAALFRPALSRASLHVARGRALEEDDEREESSDDGGSTDRMRSQGKTTTTTRAVAARCAASAAPGRAAATSAENPTAAASPPPAAATAAATSELAALHSSTPTAPSCCSRLKPARPPCMCALLMLGQSSATCRVLHALLSLLL